MTTDDDRHEHLSMEAAADFDERLLDAAASADVAARVASCATCAATLDVIHRTRAALAELPAVPMPADVADRLQAAVAAEAQAARVPGGAATVTALATRRRRLWIPIGVGVAAAGALVFALQLNDQPSNSTTAAAASPAAASGSSTPFSVSANVRTLASGTDYKTAPREDISGRLAGAPVAVRQLDTNQLKLTGQSPGDSATSSAIPTASTSASAPVAASLPSVANAPSTAAASAAAGGTAYVYKADGLSRYGALLDQATLDQCILRLLDPDAPVQPTVIDYASYAGKPALAIFFPAEAGQLNVYVVGLACGTKDDVLAFLRVPAAP